MSDTATQQSGTIKCRQCGRQFPSHLARPIHCHCGELIGGKPTPRPHRVRRRVRDLPHNHWLPLHRYGAENFSRWSPDAARRFFFKWQQDIPPYCGCQEDFQTLTGRLPPVFDSAEAFARRAWEWHDDVSVRIDKPRITWPECESLFGCPWSDLPTEPLLIVTALSQLRSHIDRQTVCLDSWLAAGASIKAVNTPEEIRNLKPMYPQVDAWEASYDLAGPEYAYPTQKIRRLALACEGKAWLVNSDIEIHGNPATLNKYQLPGSQVYGLRWNYKDSRLVAKEFEWGIDAVWWGPGMAETLPDDFPFAIGHAMWDYAVPYYLMKNGFRLTFMHERFFYHEEHKQNWNQSSWNYGSKWLSDTTSLNVQMQEPSNAYRYSLDPGHYYDHAKGRWMQAETGNMPTVERLDYEQWKESAEGKDYYAESPV